jgi:hypothetical protein
MGTWGGAERVVQPTDQVSGRFSCFPTRHGDREEDERAAGQQPQGLVAMQTVKFQFFRLVMTLSAIAALAIAGGASLKGW